MFFPLFDMPGVPELIIILVVVLVLFGAKKLPEIARSSGQALRIFKDETKQLKKDDEAKAESVAAPKVEQVGDVVDAETVETTEPGKDA